MSGFELSRRRLLAAVPMAGAATIAGCSSFPESESESENGVVQGWYPGWERAEYPPDAAPFSRLDELYYANLEPDPDGTVVFPSDDDEPNLADFRDLKREGEPAEDVRMGFAVGGWNSSQHFSDAARTQENRERFAETAIATMREYDFDGFEIDWEFPTGGGLEENVEREEDTENVIELVEECRTRLDDAMDEDDREYRLSYSAPAQPEHVTPLDVSALAELVDWINVMAYDMVDESSSETAHNAPLYGSPSTNEAVETWADEGMSRSDMMIGHAFYGRAFDGVDPGSDGDGLGQPFEEYEATLPYDEISARIDDPSWDRYWDEDAAAPYLYDPDDRNWVSATDPEYVETKTTYALDEGCRGVFCWELAYDANGELIDVMTETVDDYSSN